MWINLIYGHVITVYVLYEPCVMFEKIADVCMAPHSLSARAG